MGLDMYLNGKKFLPHTITREEDGFEVKEIRLRLGYWRKHPNLHGYIVETFAKGEDNCEPIELNTEDMENIIQAVKEKKLPLTGGFFFGASDGSEDAETIEIFEKAIEWLKDRKNDGSWSHVEYQASW